MKKKRKYQIYLWLIPMLVIMGSFVYYPIIVTFTYSLKRMKLTRPDNIKFIGTENYQNILGAKEFWTACQNTAILILLVVGITVFCGMLTAFLLNRDSRISHLLTAAAIIPWAMPPVVNGIIWKFIFYPGYGFLNKLLLGLHLIEKPIGWISNRWTLLFVVAVVVAWRAIPFFAVVCLSGLKAVPEELYEAARIDGCNTVNKLHYITLPLVKPFLAIGITSASVTAFNIFDEIVSLYGYGDMAMTLQMENYLTTFSYMDFGKGSAITYLIMLFAGMLGFFYLKSLNKEGDIR